MIGCVGAALILFAGLFWTWILYDWLAGVVDVYQAQTNGMSVVFKSFVDLAVISIPLLMLIMSFVVAYTYLQRKRRSRNA
jgi:hypothetical protein